MTKIVPTPAQDAQVDAVTAAEGTFSLPIDADLKLERQDGTYSTVYATTDPAIDLSVVNVSHLTSTVNGIVQGEINNFYGEYQTGIAYPVGATFYREITPGNTNIPTIFWYDVTTAITAAANTSFTAIAGSTLERFSNINTADYIRRFRNEYNRRHTQTVPGQTNPEIPPFGSPTNPVQFGDTYFAEVPNRPAHLFVYSGPSATTTLTSQQHSQWDTVGTNFRGAYPPNAASFPESYTTYSGDIVTFDNLTWLRTGATETITRLFPEFPVQNGEWDVIGGTPNNRLIPTIPATSPDGILIHRQGVEGVVYAQTENTTLTISVADGLVPGTFNGMGTSSLTSGNTFRAATSNVITVPTTQQEIAAFSPATGVQGFRNISGSSVVLGGEFRGETGTQFIITNNTNAAFSFDLVRATRKWTYNTTTNAYASNVENDASNVLINNHTIAAGATATLPLDQVQFVEADANLAPPSASNNMNGEGVSSRIELVLTGTTTLVSNAQAAATSLRFVGASQTTRVTVGNLFPASIVGLDDIPTGSDGLYAFRTLNGVVAAARVVTQSPTPPTSPLPGDMWHRSTDGNMFVRNTAGSWLATSKTSKVLYGTFGNAELTETDFISIDGGNTTNPPTYIIDGGSTP